MAVALALTSLVIIFVIAGIRRWWFWQVKPMAAFPTDRIVIWGHRGSPMEAPENTLDSFTAAIRNGVDGIELDVMLSADGEVMVRHDFDLERTTDGSGWVDQTTYADLRQLNAAHHWPEFPAQIIPTLGEVLAILPAGMLVNVELKARSWRSVGLERRVVDILREFDVLDRTLISSFNPMVLRRIQKIEPKLAIGFLWWNVDVRWYLARPLFFNYLRPQFLHPSQDVITADVVERAHKRGAKVNVWTIKNRPMVEKLVNMGVDGIFTDYPQMVIETTRETSVDDESKQA